MIPTLSEALAERGFDTLTEVQQAVTAPELAEADLLVSAQTGSGKTVGFGLAIAPTLLGEDSRFGPPAAPLALIVAPTRELAMQVKRELDWLFQKAGARVVSCIGGMDAREERRALDRGAHIVVGTPGRLRDHITRNALDLGDIRAIVLDEADEMLDLGFREDLEFMLGAAPAGRRTLLFSATVPGAIAELAKTFQRDAVRVSTVSGGQQHSDIAYQAIQVAAHDTENAIINLLRYHDAPNAIVFANTRATVSRLAARFSNRGLAVVSLSGELSQDERSHALQAMRDGRARVCVATDVAARGIDLPNLALVIHADLPQNTEALLHRSGRTGRAGRKGISALIVPDKVSKKAARLLQWAKISAEWTHPPSADDILALDETRLLEDAAWAPEHTEAETTFAAKLIAQHSAEEIAIACLRLYRAGLSAPEDLNAPEARAPRAERAAFGPSVWFSLSVGQDKRAEARWLLPLLLRAGNLDKAQIGKIRVEAVTTYVEVAEAAAAGLEAQLGADGLLEDGIHAHRLASPPPDRGPSARPPRPPRPDDDRPRKPAKPREPKPDRAEQTAAPRPAASEAPAAAAREKPRAKPPKKDDGFKPDTKRADKGDKKDWAKPAGKPAGKPGGKPGGKPAGKSFGKPGAKPFAKPAGKPARAARPDASDTTKRFERPDGKPGGRPARKPGAGGPAGKPGGPGRGKPPRGGDATPRRKG